MLVHTFQRIAQLDIGVLPSYPHLRQPIQPTPRSTTLRRSWKVPTNRRFKPLLVVWREVTERYAHLAQGI